MDLYQLKTFFTLAKENHFTRAAERLFVTQSAVSHALKKLETSVGTPLIKRRGKDISLTRAGALLFRSCEKIFYEIQRVDQDIAEIREEAVVGIRLGSPVEFGTHILINHIRPFLDLNPKVHLDFLFSHHLETPLLRDEVDLIIDCKDHALPRVDKIHLFQEEYVVIASPEFIQTHGITTLDDLERVNILSNDKHLKWWKNFLAAIPEEKGRCLKKVVQINHTRGLINGAISGLGIAFVPKYTVIRELEKGILSDPFP
ncbi:MAG: LysR family transcriptional regulator, partial [Desulfovibrionales bacterium]|nr:LysR family transcriptional regulator [Desulfovibrionales bacterium]